MAIFSVNKMIIRTVLSLLCFFICCNTFAQKHWNINGGINFTYPTTSFLLNYKMGIGEQLGVTYTADLINNISIISGLEIDHHTWKFNDLYYFTKDLDVEMLDHEFSEWNLSVPLLCDYEIEFTKLGLHFITGPQLFYGLDNRLKVFQYKGTDDISNLDMYTNSYSGIKYKRFNTAWSIGTGISVKDFTFYFKASLGLTNIAKETSYKVHKNNYSISIGYYFK